MTLKSSFYLDTSFRLPGLISKDRDMKVEVGDSIKITAYTAMAFLTLLCKPDCFRGGLVTTSLYLVDSQADILEGLCLSFALFSGVPYLI